MYVLKHFKKGANVSMLVFLHGKILGHRNKTLSAKLMILLGEDAGGKMFRLSSAMNRPRIFFLGD